MTMSLSSWRNVQAFMIIVLVCTLLPVASVWAGPVGTVYMTAPQVQTEIYDANVLTRYSGVHQTQALLEMTFLKALYEDSPQLSPQGAQRQLLEYRSKFEAERKGLPEGYDEAQKALLYTQIGVKVVSDLLPGNAGKVAKALDPILDKLGTPAIDAILGTSEADRAVNGLQDMYYLAQPLWSAETTRDVLEGVHEAAQNPYFEQAFDATFGAELNASLKSSSEDILAHNPLLQSLQEVREIQGMIQSGNGAIRADMDQLKGLVSGLVDNVNERFDTQTDLLQAIAAEQSDLLNYAKRTEVRAQMEQRARDEAERTKKVIDGVRGGISILSKLIGLGDPKLGKQVESVGTSLLQIGTAAVELATGIASANPFLIVSSAAEILGGIFNIFGAFEDTGPTTDELILQQLQQIAENIKTLSDQMHTRFDRIERGIKQMYDTMAQNFKAINWELQLQSQQLADIRTELNGVSHNLDLLHAQLLTWFQTLGNRPLKHTMDEALGYQQRTGQPLDYASQFQHFESEFYVWANHNATDEVEAPTVNRGVTDEDLYEELQRDANLNYLARVMRERSDIFGGVPKFVGDQERLPNIATWTLAASVYAQLESEWPQYAARISPTRHRAIVTTGERLQRALHDIAVLDTPQGAQPNLALFDHLLNNYDQKFDTFVAALRNKESLHTHEWWDKENHFSVPVDPFGGVGQDIGFYALPLRNYCDGRAIIAPASPSNATRLAPAQVRLARFLGVPMPTLDLCVVADRFVSHATNATNQSPPVEMPNAPPDPEVCLPAQWTMTLGLRFDGQQIAQTTASVSVPPTAPRLPVCSWNLGLGRSALTTAFQTSAFSKVESAWNVSADTVTPAVSARLMEGQKRVYGNVLTDLVGGDLKTEATKLTGAKALLATFARYGLPVALGNDEILDSLIGGDQSLYDLDLIRFTYAQGKEHPDIANNVRVVIGDNHRRRSSELRVRLADHVEQVARASMQRANSQDDKPLAAQEGHALLDYVLLRLKWSESMIRLYQRPSPLNGRVIFLPMATTR